jgi:hypothetical protein
MRSNIKTSVNPHQLLGHVRDGQSIQIFDHEDLAAEFIGIIKMYDPDDDLIYVIYPHSSLAGKFIIKIYSPLGNLEDEGFDETETVVISMASVEKTFHKEAA